MDAEMQDAWLVVPGEPYHIYPLNDLREHALEGTACWCIPDHEEYRGHLLVCHHSADRREVRERGRYDA